MKPLLIFFVLLILGAMFLIGENPEYNPFNSESNAEVTSTTTDTTSDTLQKSIKEEDKHLGEQ